MKVNCDQIIIMFRMMVTFVNMWMILRETKKKLLMIIIIIYWAG